MELDDEDYELLGYGDSYAVTAQQVDSRVRQRLIWLKTRYGKEWRDSPEGRKLRKDARARFMKTDKGKALRARVWKTYYEKNRAALIEKNRQRRKAEREST